MTGRTVKDASGLVTRALVAIMVVSTLSHLLATFQPAFADEYAPVGNVWDFLIHKTIIPSHTAYPALYSYMIAPFIGVFAATMVALGTPPSYYDYSEFMAYSPLVGLWPARVVTLICWAGSVWVVYWIGRELFDEMRLALVGPVALSSAVGILEYSGYALPDVPMMFLAALSLLYVLRLARGECVRRNAVLAGLFCGLAIATKYTAIAVIPSVLVGAWLAAGVGRRERLLLVARIVTAVAAGFVAGCPGWVLAPAHHWQGFTKERVHMATGHLGYTGVPVLGQLELLLRADGLLLILAVIGAIVGATAYRRRAVPVLLAVVAGVLLVVAPAKKQSLQYLFALYPAFAVLAPLGLSAAGATLRRALVGTSALGFAGVALIGLVWAFRVAVLPDSLDVSREWINATIPEHTKLAVDWSYVPRLLDEAQLARLRGDLRSDFVRGIYAGMRGYATEPIEYESDYLATNDAEYLVTSSRCYDRFFCYGLTTRLPPPEGSALRAEFLRRKEFYSLLFNRPGGWRLEHEVRTGNGPQVLVFRRAVR